MGPRDETDLGGETTGDPVDPENSTVADIQTGTISEGETVSITGVIVTSLSDGEGFFVQDAGGGDYSGIYVYGTSMEVSVGDALSVTGEVTEFYDMTELVVSSDSDISVTGSGEITVTYLTESPSDWEVYEGMLISLAGIQLSGDPDEYGQSETGWDGMTVDDKFYDYFSDFDSTSDLQSITGVLGYSYSAWRLYPRDAADFSL